MELKLHLIVGALAILTLVVMYGAGQSFKVPDTMPDKIKVPSNFKIPDKVSLPGGNEIKIPKLPKNVNIANIDKMDSIDVNFVKGFDIKRKYEKDGELSCIQFAKDMLVKGLPAFNDCMKEMQLTIGKLRKKLRDVLPCLVKCIGIKLNILQADGLFNIDYAKNLLAENVPKRFMDYIWKIWDTCLEFVKGLVPNDPTCKTYKPLIKCAVDAALKIAAEAMKLCPDIPDVFKNTAKSYIKSKKQRTELDTVVGLNGHA